MANTQVVRSENGLLKALRDKGVSGGDRHIRRLAKELLHYNDDGRLVARLGFNAQD
jgi:hypothetical protein